MIKDDIEHNEALHRINDLWRSKPGTVEFKEQDCLADEVVEYEDKRWPFPPKEI